MIMVDNESTGLRPLDDILGELPKEGVYGLAYDKAAEYLREVLKKMSARVGWKDPSRPFDFDGFSGFYPEIHEDHADICRGEYIVATFNALPDGRLGFESFGEAFSQYPDDINPWYPLADIMDGKFCLEQINLEKAVQETHHGQEIVYGLRFGEDTAIACSLDDTKLRSALVEREPSIRMVSPEKFVEAVGRWLDRDSVPGFESDLRPEIVRYAWDGQTLRSEKEVNINQSRQLNDSWGNDWDLIAELRRQGDEIRTELEKEVGITDGKHFKFENALYPSLSMRDDALFLSSSCGRSMGDFITVTNGNVSLYREYDPDKALSEPVKRFSSVREALDTVRDVVLGEKNISLAAKDYQSYLLDKANKKTAGIEVEQAAKGVKIR